MTLSSHPSLDTHQGMIVLGGKKRKETWQFKTTRGLRGENRGGKNKNGRDNTHGKLDTADSYYTGGHAVISDSCREQVTHTWDVGFRGAIILEIRGSGLGVLGLEWNNLSWLWFWFWGLVVLKRSLRRRLSGRLILKKRFVIPNYVLSTP